MSTSLSRRLAQHLTLAQSHAPSSSSSSSYRSISTSVPLFDENPSASTSSPPLRARRSTPGRTRPGQGGRAGREDRPGGGAGGGRSRRPAAFNRALPPYPEWLRGAGREQYADSNGKGPFWISKTPFPLNPSFNPPAPVAQRVRDEMWKMHCENSRRWTVRNLSGLFGQTMERTQAILRLKALEGEMQSESLPLQTDFQLQMERLLGSEAHLPRPSQDPKRPDMLGRPESPREVGPATPREGVVTVEARGPLAEELRDEDLGPDGEVNEANVSQSYLGQQLAAQRQETRRRLRLVPSGAPQHDKGQAQATRSFLAPSSETKIERKTALRIVDLSTNLKDGNASVYSKVGTLGKNRKKAASRNRAAEKKKLLASQEQQRQQQAKPASGTTSPAV